LILLLVLLLEPTSFLLTHSPNGHIPRNTSKSSNRPFIKEHQQATISSPQIITSSYQHTISKNTMPPNPPALFIPHTLHCREAAQRVGLQNDMFLWGLIVAEHGFAKGIVNKVPGSGRGIYRWDPSFWRVVEQVKDKMYKDFCGRDGEVAGAGGGSGRSGRSGGGEVVGFLPTVFSIR
jgi:hypothetical protein